MAQPHTVGKSVQTPSLGLPIWVHAFAWSALVLLTLLLAGISRAGQGRNVWEGWRESSELRRPVYAERVYVNEVCRQVDVAGRFTGPDAWLQGHSLWHLLTSVSLACMYLYYRSEAPTSSDDAIPSNRAGSSIGPQT